MTIAGARAVTTNQVGVHENLCTLFAKHNASNFKRPIAKHTALAFSDMLTWLSEFQGDVIIDAGCGVGESTVNIASQNPNARVVGIDKSSARLHKHQSYAAKKSVQNDTSKGENYLLLQADLVDFWRLLVSHVEDEKPQWQVIKQFILYPNPYPKKSQVSKRWHASALFPYIVKISRNIEVRSNWRLYLQEFLLAAEYHDLQGSIVEIDGYSSEFAYTPFERKYIEAHQTCYKLEVRASGRDKK